MNGNHNRIIAARAKHVLGGTGFRQQGRSRLWLADHQSWLNVIEFTPDRWTKAVSLTNAVHWLWAGTGFLAFHESIPSRSHVGFETEEQFNDAVEKIVGEAETKAADIGDRFSSLEQAAEFLIDRAKSSPDRMQPSWWGYQAGIACALTGQAAEAKIFLSGISDARVLIHSVPLLPLVERPDQFKERINQLVDLQRAALHLSPLENRPF